MNKGAALFTTLYNDVHSKLGLLLLMPLLFAIHPLLNCIAVVVIPWVKGELLGEERL